MSIEVNNQAKEIDDIQSDIDDIQSDITDIAADTDNIGDLDGFISVPYSFGTNKILDHLNTSYYHVHGQAFVYPDHANAVQLTSGAGAWDITGALVPVIPKGAANVSSFDLHWINIADISAVAEVQVDIFAGDVGSEVRIGATRSQRNTNQSRENANRIQIPQQVVGTRISCRLSDSTAGFVTVKVSFEGHYYA